MFLLVPAYPGCPGQTAVKWLLLLVVVVVNYTAVPDALEICLVIVQYFLI